MFYEINSAGEIQDVSPRRIARVIEQAKPAVVSVRTPCGDELTISDISIDVRMNGIHILLDCPEAERVED
jgi:hypothetical protein